MSKRRVVITGLGTVNPAGQSVDEFWNSLMTGKSGIAPIKRFSTEGYASTIGGEVKDWSAPPKDMLSHREAKRMDRFTLFAVQAGLTALKDSELDITKTDPTRCATIIGSGIGGLMTFEEQHSRMLEKGPGKISPFTVPRMMVNAASGHLGILAGFQGTNFSVVTACASAAHAIGESLRVIQRGEADVALTGGSEAALSRVGLASFCALKGLSTRNDDPTHASRPWDKDRDGFLLSEGAGCLILEELEHAKARGAKIYAEVIGYGSSCDAHHITAPAPDGSGASRAMAAAIKDGGITPEQVEYVNAHGTSTNLGDIAETNAIKRVFGEWATNGLLVSSTKSITGHLLGASGGVELIACCKALEENILPATFNLENPDEGCDLDYIPNEPREKRVDVILSNSFGFGGHNGCILIRRYED